MRILHLSDTHLGAEGPPPLGAPPGWSWAQDHQQAFEAALALAGGADLVLHTGDLFDRSRPPRRAAAQAVACLSAVARRVPVVVLAGNHDRRGLLRHLPRRPGLQVHDEPARVVVAGLRLAVVPYRRSAEAWAQAAREAVGEGVDLVCAHQSVEGSRVPGFRFRVGAVPETLGEEHLPRGVLHVASGHLHPRQVLALGPATVVHGGSTARTSFSERAETKGVVLWTFGRRVETRFVDLPSRPMLMLTHDDDLAQVTPGMLVRAERGSALRPDWTAEVLARGGWVVPRRAPAPNPASNQLGLFGESGGRRLSTPSATQGGPSMSTV